MKLFLFNSIAIIIALLSFGFGESKVITEHELIKK